MHFDIRTPIGAMFFLIGILLMVYGVSMTPAAAPGSAGLNVDAAWGGVMALFGIAMLALARRALVRKPRVPPSEREP